MFLVSNTDDTPWVDAEHVARQLVAAQLEDGPGILGPQTMEILEELERRSKDNGKTTDAKFVWFGQVAGYAARIAAEATREAEALRRATLN